MSKDRNRVENRVLINQKSSNKKLTTVKVERILKKIEYENIYCKTFEINRSNTSILSLDNYIFLIDFSSNLVILFKNLTRTIKIFALYFEKMKYKFKKTLFKPTRNFESH